MFGMDWRTETLILKGTQKGVAEWLDRNQKKDRKSPPPPRKKRYRKGRKPAWTQGAGKRFPSMMVTGDTAKVKTTTKYVIHRGKGWHASIVANGHGDSWIGRVAMRGDRWIWFARRVKEILDKANLWSWKTSVSRDEKARQRCLPPV